MTTSATRPATRERTYRILLWILCLAAAAPCLVLCFRWHSPKVKPLLVFRGQETTVGDAAVSPDGRLLCTVHYDGKAVLWALDSALQLAVFRFPNDPATCLAFASDRTSLTIATSHGTVHSIDLRTGNDIRTTRAFAGLVKSVAYDPEGTLLAAAGGDPYAHAPRRGWVRIWDLRDDKDLGLIITPGGMVNRVVFSPDGKTLATAANGSGAITLWDIATKRELARFTGHKNGNAFVAWAPDGKTLCSGSPADDKVFLLDPRTLDVKDVLAGHLGGVGPMAFSPDSSVLALPSTRLPVDHKGYAALWQFGPNRKLLLEFGEREVTAVAFSPDGKYLVTGCLGGRAQLWELAKVLKDCE